MNGRKPKPTAQKRLEGNPGQRRLNDAEPIPGLDLPEPPAWLMTDARKEWFRVAPDLIRMGVLTGDDWTNFAAYCQTWARLCNLERRMKRATFEERHDRKIVTTFRDYLMQLRSLGSEFGLTPASRTRLSGDPKDKGDDFEDFVQLNVVNG